MRYRSWCANPWHCALACQVLNGEALHDFSVARRSTVALGRNALGAFSTTHMHCAQASAAATHGLCSIGEKLRSVASEHPAVSQTSEPVLRIFLRISRRTCCSATPSHLDCSLGHQARPLFRQRACGGSHVKETDRMLGDSDVGCTLLPSSRSPTPPMAAKGRRPLSRLGRPEVQRPWCVRVDERYSTTIEDKSVVASFQCHPSVLAPISRPSRRNASSRDS